jgi:hypothetical protein
MSKTGAAPCDAAIQHSLSWAAAHAADQSVSGNAEAFETKLLRVLELDRVGERLSRFLSRVWQSRAPEKFNDVLLRDLHGDPFFGLAVVPDHRCAGPSSHLKTP